VPTTQSHVNKELKEELLIVEANAVIHPRAMMIHSGDTVFADRTVMTHGRFNTITLFARFR
jgi:hypothetical protein